MFTPRVLIIWKQTTADMGYAHEVGATPEGQFLLGHPGEDGLVRVNFQLPVPDGLTFIAHFDALSAAREAAEPMSREYWRVAGTFPYNGPEQGYFASHAMAHAVIAAAQERESADEPAAILAAAGFVEAYAGLWQRKTRCGRISIRIAPEGVHAWFDRRGSHRMTHLLRLYLAREGQSGTVYANWPAFMANLPALTAIAVDAADYADAQGLTGPKRALRKAA